jgi:hypothetical protein
MITRNFLAGLDFRVMTGSDRMGFAGCESPVPLIAESGDDYIVVIDGNYCEVVSVDGDVVDQCDDIVGLPYAPIALDLGSGMYDARPGNEDSFSNLGME